MFISLVCNSLKCVHVFSSDMPNTKCGELKLWNSIAQKRKSYVIDHADQDYFSLIHVHIMGINVQILDYTVCILFYANALGKGMTPSLLLAIGKE